MDMNQQIDSMKSKVSSIDLRALASTVRSMTEDLTSRGNVVINDSKRLYGIIDHCLTRSPFKKHHLKGRLPQQIVTVRWAMISALAKLVVLQHLSELSRFEIHTDLVIDLKPLIRPDGTPHPTQLKLRDERPTVLRRRDEIPTPNGETPSLVLPLGVQRSENWAIMTLGDEWAYGTSPDGKILGRPDRHDHRRYSPYDVMTKISIELAGLESYDLQTVLAYSSTQHDFVMSEVGLLTDDDKEFVDDVYSSLIYGCRLPFMTMDQHQRDGRWMDGGSTDGEDDSMYDAPMELKQLLMTAVLGSCRMRPCDGVYDAASLTGRLQEDAPLGPRRVLSKEESAELDGFLRSTNWTDNLNYWENVQKITKWHNPDDPFSIPVRFKDVPHLFADGQDSWFYSFRPRANPAWTVVPYVDWSRLNHYDLVPVHHDFDLPHRPDVLPSHVPLSDSILSVIPKSVRRQYTEDRLRGIESKTHLIRNYLFMEDRDMAMIDALNVISQADPDLQRRVVEGLINAHEDEPHSSFLVGDAPCSIDDPTTGDTTNDGQAHEDLDAQGEAEVIQRTYSLYQIDRYLQDMKPDGDDPYGSLTLPDIVVMMSLLCVLYNSAFPDVIGLDPSFPYYDALVHECLRFRTSLHDTIGTPEGDLYMTFSSESSEESENLRIIFKELEDVLINAVIHRLAAEFDGTYSEGLPEEYMIEDVSMDVHGRYSDVVESRLGKSTSPLWTESALKSHA